MSDVRWRIAVTALLVGMAPCPHRIADARGRASSIGAPVVRIVPIATFDSLSLTVKEPGAWSPRGARLALQAPRGQLWVFDTGSSPPSPRFVYDTKSWIHSCGWSPDGGWLLVLFSIPTPRNGDTLVAVPVDGGQPDTLLAGVDIWPATWSSDGSIHCRVGGLWRTLPPPAAWKPSASFVPPPLLAAEVGPGLTLRLRPFVSGQPGERVMVGTYFASGRWFQVLDALPDGSRSLVAVADDTSWARRVVDGRGRTLLDLRQAGVRFEPTAISGDGRLIVGYTGDWIDEQGWTRTWLEAADAAGRWSARVEGGEGGSDPQLSREGSFIAFRSAKGTTVARLVIEPR